MGMAMMGLAMAAVQASSSDGHSVGGSPTHSCAAAKGPSAHTWVHVAWMCGWVS